MIFQVCCVALLALISLLLCVILERAKDICEYLLRITYGHTTLSRQLGDVHEAQNLSLRALEKLNDKLDALTAEKAAEEKPGTPDEGDERSEADKAAEKAFSEGVLAILNYDATTIKEAKD